MSRKIRIQRLEVTTDTETRHAQAGILPRIEALKARILASNSITTVEKSSWVRQLTRLSRDLALRDAPKVPQSVPQPVEDWSLDLNYAGFVGRNDEVMRMLEIAARVASSNLPVLLLGESGTGKELLANIIYLNSDSEKLVTVNCGALPPNLIESELFGHVKGSFSGAIRDRQGMFEAADGGTIFLDEVGDLSLSAQVKLLRALQFGEIQRVGSDVPIRVEVRVIAATNRDLQKAVEKGEFREDLYYRLCVCELYLPPLRQRRDEIWPLMQHFLNQAAMEYNKPVPRLSNRLQTYLFKDYDFPGNIRELKNLCSLMVVLSKNQHIDFEDLPPRLFKNSWDNGSFTTSSANGNGRSDTPLTPNPRHWQDQQVREFLIQLLVKHAGNVRAAYPESGYSRSRFYQLLKSHDLDPKDYKKAS